MIALGAAAGAAAEEWRFNFQNNFGDTNIDFEELLGSQMYSASLPPRTTQITDTDTFFYKGVGQVFYSPGNGWAFGGEAGFNHLYYWEERYYSTTSGYQFRSADAWTFQAGPVVEYSPNGRFFVQGGLSLHSFYTTSGSALGIMGAVGYNLFKGERYSFPLQLRYDVITGDATPSALNIGIGIQFHKPS